MHITEDTNTDNDDGWVCVAGLGPGSNELITPQVSEALNEATDIVGYNSYVERLHHLRKDITIHASDNRVELERGQLALKLASMGKKVVVVSSGDPGVFAMASALFEAIEKGDPLWRKLEIHVLPGITAMLAAAAALGAPLGHDFCAINLSDNLKPWHIIAKRIQKAAEGSFAMAFYNPRSKSRPHQFMEAMNILREVYDDDILIAFARAVSTPQQELTVVPLSQVTENMADMRTVVLVGNNDTRQVGRFLYTPRSTC